MVQGPAAGLAALDTVANDPHLATYPYLAATRADLLRRLGRAQDAAQAYRTALTLATNTAEKGFLTRRLAEVTVT
jgi:RNA polymerase sigma-70 factor (ECF subfamily)